MTSFAEAMKEVLSGGFARRRDWNRPLCIYALFYSMDQDRQQEGVFMEMRDGRKGPYTPSQCDMLANDWIRAKSRGEFDV